MQEEEIAKKKQELSFYVLQQRIGELVSSYESQIASLRADITILYEMQTKKEDNESILEQ